MYVCLFEVGVEPSECSSQPSVVATPMVARRQCTRRFQKEAESCSAIQPANINRRMHPARLPQGTYAIELTALSRSPNLGISVGIGQCVPPGHICNTCCAAHGASRSRAPCPSAITLRELAFQASVGCKCFPCCNPHSSKSHCSHVIYIAARQPRHWLKHASHFHWLLPSPCCVSACAGSGLGLLCLRTHVPKRFTVHHQINCSASSDIVKSNRASCSTLVSDLSGL